jgi:hypothetical protein
MKHSVLVAFLEGELSPLRFSTEIAPEVDACLAAIEATGRGRIVIEPGPETVLTRAHARRLLQALSDGSLSYRAASYVADCIIMGHDFDAGDDDAVLEAIHFAADDYAPPTEDEIRSALERLG